MKAAAGRITATRASDPTPDEGCAPWGWRWPTLGLMRAASLPTVDAADPTPDEGFAAAPQAAMVSLAWPRRRGLLSRPSPILVPTRGLAVVVAVAEVVVVASCMFARVCVRVCVW